MTRLTWHEYLVWVLLVPRCDDVSALEGLWEVAKDIVDNEDTGLRLAVAGDVGLQAIDGGVRPLLLVVVASDRRHCATGVRLGGYSRHDCVSAGVNSRCALCNEITPESWSCSDSD